MPKTDPQLEAATKSLSNYLYWVHDTDMRHIHGGKAMPAAHHKDMMEYVCAL